MNQSQAATCQWSPRTVQEPTKLASCRREGRCGFKKNYGTHLSRTHLTGGVNHGLTAEK